MFVDNETMAIKSAGCIFASTYFFAESTARSIWSTSIAEKSKNKRISRRSRASIVACGFRAGAAAAAAFSVPVVVGVVCPASANSSIFSKSKLETCCFCPSSTTLKSSRFKSRTKLPFLSRATTFTSTSSVVARMACGACAGGGVGDCCAGACCARLANGSSSIKATALAIARILRANIQFPSLKPETCDKRDPPHGRGRGHFAKGQRVDGRIQAGELHDVKNIVGLNSQIQ